MSFVAMCDGLGSAAQMFHLFSPADSTNAHIQISRHLHIYFQMLQIHRAKLRNDSRKVLMGGVCFQWFDLPKHANHENQTIYISSVWSQKNNLLGTPFSHFHCLLERSSRYVCSSPADGLITCKLVSHRTRAFVSILVHSFHRRLCPQKCLIHELWRINYLCCTMKGTSIVPDHKVSWGPFMDVNLQRGRLK